MDSQKIAVLGLGSRSTAFYLERLNALFETKFGGYGTCPLTLVNSNFAHINPFLPDQFAALDAALMNYLTLFDGFDNVLIPNITLHETVERLASKGLSTQHIVDPVSSSIFKLKQYGIGQVCLFGSSYSMNSAVLRARLTNAGIEVNIPNVTVQDQLDQLRQRIYHRRESAQDLADYADLLEDTAQHCTVLLACTELSIVVPPGLDLMTVNTVFDMASLQIERCFFSVYPAA